MIRNQDLFDDKPMSFGDHLEELRVHLIKALLGAAIGVVLALFIGQHVVSLVRKPIDDALRRRGVSQFGITEDIGQKNIYDFIREWFNRKSASKKHEENPAVDSNKDVTSTKPEPSPVKNPSGENPGIKSDPQSTSNQEKTPAESKEMELKLKGEYLEVQVSARELTSELNKQMPGTFPKMTDDQPDQTINLTLRAKEFSYFREVALRGMRPVSLNVQEPFLVFLKVSMVAGLLLSSPWIIYQIWMFVAVGLYHHERKLIYYFGGVSMFLFMLGAVFCYFLVFPIVLDFLLTYNDWLGVEPQIRLSEWINFALMLPVMFGISFQLPLVMVFLEKLNVVSAKDYTDYRRMSILIISIVSMILTPSDPYSMLLMMVPLLILYELGIVFCKFTATKDPFANQATS